MKGKKIVFIIIIFTAAVLGLAWYLLRDIINSHDLELNTVINTLRYLK